jgi:RHS repeat-associated protein
MQHMPMRVKRACWITFVVLVLAAAAPAHLSATDLEQQIISAITCGDDNNLTSATETYSSHTRLTTLSYDTFDRLTGMTDGFGKSVGYEYDANGNRTRLIDADGASTRYSYDALNRISEVTLPSAGTATYSFDRSSLPSSVVYPNGTRADYSFDQASRLTLLENSTGSTVISSYQYTYDLNSNRLSQVELNGGASETTTYGYDDADRLTEVVYPDRTITYTLDAVGNRMNEVDSAGGGKTYSYDLRYRLQSVIDELDPTRSIYYTWDDNGNTTSRTRNGVTTDLRYDVRNQLLEVDHEGSQLARYSYDYRGLRVVKHSLGGQLRYVYDDSSVLHQTNALGETVAKYDYGADALLSVDHFSEGRSFYLFDGLGSVANLVDDSGSIQARYKYDAWGNIRSSDSNRWNPFGFTGHEWDEETGLYYAKARFYDPEIGRFLTEDAFEGDPRSPPSLHRYLYANANPTVFIDPDGNIAILKDFQKWLRRGKEDCFEVADEYKNTDFAETAVGNVVGRQVGGILGAFAGCISVLDGLVGIANAATNVVVMSVAPDSELSNQAAGEFDETWDSLTQAYNLIKEDPGKVGSMILDKGTATFKGFIEGDPRAVAEVTSIATEIAVEIAAGTMGSKTAVRALGVVEDLGEAVTETAVKATRRITHTADEIKDAGDALGKGSRVAKETAEAAGEATESAGRAVTRNVDEAAATASRQVDEASNTAAKATKQAPSTPKKVEVPKKSRGAELREKYGHLTREQRRDRIKELAGKIDDAPSGGTKRGNQKPFADSAEELVSKHTGVPLNEAGQTIPGSGKGGVRVPDFPVRGPKGSIRHRGSVMEVKASHLKNFGDMSSRSRKQILDMVAYARRLRARAGMVQDPKYRKILENAHVEVFSDLAAPTSGRFFRLIEQGLIKWRPIPRS